MNQDWDRDSFGESEEEHKITCRRCDSTNVSQKYDYYNISTGYWCEDCYKNNYPYRKDDYYDYFNAGEYLNDDY